MEAGSVKEFVNNLTIQDEMVRYDGHLYYFYGIRNDKFSSTKDFTDKWENGYTAE